MLIVLTLQALRLGPFEFTLGQLFISVVSTVIVFPPSLIIVTIFRKARGKKNKVEHVHQTQQLAKRSRKFRWRKFTAGSRFWGSTEVTRLQRLKEGVRGILSFHQRKNKPHDAYIAKEETAKRKKKKGFSLPHWTIYIAWIRE